MTLTTYRRAVPADLIAWIWRGRSPLQMPVYCNVAETTAVVVRPKQWWATATACGADPVFQAAAGIVGRLRPGTPMPEEEEDSISFEMAAAIAARVQGIVPDGAEQPGWGTPGSGRLRVVAYDPDGRVGSPLADLFGMPRESRGVLTSFVFSNDAFFRRHEWLTRFVYAAMPEGGSWPCDMRPTLGPEVKYGLGRLQPNRAAVFAAAAAGRVRGGPSAAAAIIEALDAYGG